MLEIELYREKFKAKKKFSGFIGQKLKIFIRQKKICIITVDASGKNRKL